MGRQDMQRHCKRFHCALFNYKIITINLTTQQILT